MVFFRTEFAVPAGQPLAYNLDVPSGARSVVLEIQQDSGVMPNLEVRLSGCGKVEPPASAGWESYLLCEEPTTGGQSVRVAVVDGLPSVAKGRLLLRADLPDG